MKAASPELIALLDSNKFEMADLFTLTLLGGATMRWSSGDIAVKLGGLTFTPVPIERSETRLVMGVEVDTLSLTVWPTEDILIAGNPFLVAARIGALDGATLLLQRAFFSGFNAPAVGAMHQFEGNVSVESATGISANLAVRSMISLFNIEMPRNSYSPGCNNTLYDTGCGVNRPARAIAGTVQAGSTRQIINHVLAQPSGYFNYGVLEFLTGANAGVQVTVNKHMSDTLGLAIPLKAQPAAGDTFNVYPGCDRLRTTCKDTFNNEIRFRGMPYVPRPETAY